MISSIEKHQPQPTPIAGANLSAECDRPDPWLNVGFTPDFLVPAQFFDLTRRRSGLDGETRLVFAVLEDAVRCYVRNADSPRGYRRALFDEVSSWFEAEPGNQSPFSFAYVCDVLGIDGDFLRRQLSSLKPGDLPTKQMRSVGRRHVVRPGRRSGNRSNRRNRGITLGA